MNFDFDKNLILIQQNVKYEGIQGKITTDNIKIDLITKKIEIYMSNIDDNVEVIAK